MKNPKTERRTDARWANHNKPWTEKELEILSTKWGLVSDKALCRLLQRSPNSLHVASVRKLHQSRSMNFYTARNVAEELGIGDSKTIVFWLGQGWLFGRQCSVRAGIHKRWMFKYENIIRCLEARPWLCDLPSMPQGYFRSVVQGEWDRDRWYTCDEAAPLVGVKTSDTIQRYIRRGCLKADKRPGGPQYGRWVIRHSAIQTFLANDPRPTRSETASSNKQRVRLGSGLPVCLSVHWSVLCRLCGQRVLVMASPKMRTSARVQAEFQKVYTNGHCSHGLKCTVGLKYAEENRS